ncbi:hypothetical protein [Pseudodesulfovibrio profundus]|nr:hypothetical protein [Pseudodesulfovibrio profundus]
MNRSYAYKSHPRDESEVLAALIELTEKMPKWGFSQLFTLLRKAE